MNSGSVTKWPDRSGLLFAASLVCILLIYGLKAAAAVQTGEFTKTGTADVVYYVLWLCMAVFFFLSFKTRRRQNIWLLVMLCFAVILIFGDLRLSVIDEGAHLDYIYYIVRKHRLPTMFQYINTRLLEETGAIAGLSVAPRYEAIQVPLYYCLMAGIVRFLPSPRAALLTIRMIGLALWLVSFLLCRRSISYLHEKGFLESKELMDVVLFCAAANPGILIRCIYVSNEPLAILFGVLAVDSMFRMIFDGYSRKSTIRTFLYCILLFYTKNTGAFMVGGLLLVLLYYKKILAFFLSAGAYVMAMAPWFLRNWFLYRSVTGMNMHIRLVIDTVNPAYSAHNPVTEIFLLFDKKFFIPAEIRNGTVFTSRFLAAAALVCILLVGAGIAVELRNFLRMVFVRKWNWTYTADEKKEFVTMVCAALLFADIVMLTLSTVSSRLNTLLGRYLYLIVVPIAVLLMTWLAKCRSRKAVCVCLSVFLSLLVLDTSMEYFRELTLQRTREETYELIEEEETEEIQEENEIDDELEIWMEFGQSGMEALESTSMETPEEL